MAARALVAYERPDGRYNLHYAHWGGTAEFAGSLAPATPFGGPDPRAEWAAGLLRDLLTATAVDPGTVGGRLPEGTATRVDPAPLAVAVPRDHLPDRVDFGTHEAVHLVDRSFDVQSYLAVEFSLATVAEPSGDGGHGADSPSGGALLPVESFDAARERVAGARAALGAAVDAGLDPAAARRALRATLERWVGADRLLVAGAAGETDRGP